MNIKFTADMENNLDLIEEGEKDWLEILNNFYSKLTEDLKKYKTKVEEIANQVVLSDVKCSCGKGYMIMKNGRFGKYLACQDENCSEKISLKNMDISLEEIKKGKINVKKFLEKQLETKKGQLTDVISDKGAKFLLKNGRFGSYLESENFKEDNERISLPTEVKKMLLNNQIKIDNGVIKLKSILNEIKKEEEKILKKAGKCEKCGKPFKVGKGRWGKFLACTGYPECKNIKKIEK